MVPFNNNLFAVICFQITTTTAIIKVIELESDGDTNYNWYTPNGPQRIGRVGNLGTNQDHPNYSIVEISQDSEKYPVGLRKLAVTRTAK